MDDYSLMAADEAAQQKNARTTPVDDTYASMAATEATQRSAALGASLRQAVPVSPDKAAKVNNLSLVTGISPDVVQRNEEQIATQARVRELQSMLAASPILARQMTDPEFAKLAHADTPGLTTVERVVKGLGPAAPPEQPSFRALPDRVPTLRERLNDWWTSKVGGLTAAQKEQQQGAAEAVAIMAARAADPSLVPAADATPAQVKELNNKAWEQSREAIGGMSPGPEIAAERFAKAASLGLVAPLQQTEAHSWQSSVAGAAGQLAGFIVGPAKLAHNALGALPGFSKLAPAAGEAFTTSLAKNVLQQGSILGAASGAEEAGSALLDSRSVSEGLGKVGQKIKSGLETGAIFGAFGKLLPDNNIAQWVGRFLGVSAAQDTVDGTRPWDDRPLEDKAFGYGMNAFFTAKGGGRTEGGWFTSNPEVVKLHADAVKADQARESFGALQALSESAGAIAMREHSPEAFKQFVRNAAEEGSVRDVYVDGKTLADAFAQSGLKPEELQARMPEIAKQLDEAVQTKGDVRIPIEDYATHIAGGPLDAALMPHLKTEVDGMTYKQSEEFYQQHAEDMKADVEKILAQHDFDAARKASGDAVERELLGQMNTANRFSTQVNEVNAKLAAAMYRVQSARLGITPEEMYVKYPLQIRAESLGGAREMDQSRSLADVKQSWSDRGIDHNITENDKEISVGKIVVPKEQRGAGTGTEAMRELADYADATGKRIVLSPSTDVGGSSVNRLKAFYKSLGFVENKGKNKDFSTTESMVREPLQKGKDAYNQDSKPEHPDELLAAFDESVTAKPIKQTEKEIDDEQAKFLSSFPAGTRYTRDNRLLKRIRSASEVATAELNGSPETERQVDSPLGPFSGYKIVGEVLPPDSFNPNGHLVVKVFGNEQIQEKLTAEPALTFTISAEGELTVNGPSPNSETFAELQRRGWADYGRDAKGVPQAGWSTLQAPTEPGKNLPISQLIPLLADVHARTREWNMADYVGLHWSRATGALGGLPGMTDANGTAVFFQPKVDQTETPEFRAWAGTDKVIASDEINGSDFSTAGPFVMRAFHGTTHSFDVFDASVKGNPEGQFGAVNYFTSSRHDAADNYAGQGPDLTSRIENLKERLEQEFERVVEDGTDADDLASRINARYGIDMQALDIPRVDNQLDGEIDPYALAQDVASRVLHGGEETVMEVFVKAEKPFVVGDVNSPWFEFFDEHKLEADAIERVADNEGLTADAVKADFDTYGDQIADARYEIMDEQDNPLVEAVQKVAKKYDFDPSDLLSSLYEMAGDGTVRHNTIEEYLRQNESLSYAEHPESGVLVQSQMIGEIIQALGFDAIILKHANVRFKSMNVEDDTAHIHVFDANNTNIKSATGNDGTFDANDPSILSQGERGKISFGDDMTKKATVISLLQNADLSTFTHELGHFQLEVMNDMARHPDAPAEIREDMGKLLNWFGVESMDKWNSMSLEEKRPYHEQLARGFESYLFEGKAPSAELAGVFSRIRAWMINVYKSLAALNVNLTDEVRGVFDRMIASNEQILDAEAQRGFRPLFKSAEEMGATAEEWKAYTEQNQQQTQEAVDQLQTRALRDMQWLSNAKSKVLRKLQREAADKRKVVQAEVTAEVEQQPIYAAQHFLRTGEMRGPDGEQVKVDKGAKFDNAALKEMYPETMLARPDLSALRGMTRTDGLHPDLVAQMFGFTSGDQLVREILRAEPKASVVDGMTDQRMLERYGDLSSPDAIDRAANEALANEAHLKMLATEMKFADKAAGSRGLLVKAAKQFAAEIIARKKLSEIKPAQFEAAETKARKEAEKAHLAGDRIGVAEAKRAQLVNAHAVKMAYAALDEIKKGTAYQAKFDKESIRNKIDVDIRDQIDDLRQRFDFRKNPPEGPTRAETNLKDWIEGQIAAGYAPLVDANMVNPALRMHYKDMSVEQFRGLIDTLKSLEHIGRERQNITIGGERADLNEYVKTKLVPKLQEKGEHFTKDQLLDRAEDRHTNPIAIALDHFGSWFRAAAAQLKPQEFKRNQYDRHELLGPFGEALFDPVIDANYRKTTMLKALSDDFAAKAKELGRKWQDSLREAVTNKTLIDPDKSEEGKPVYMNVTRGKMLGMAIHVGNESNFNKLAKGWGWEPSKVWQFLHTNMAEKDWQAVQAVWDLYEKHWPEMEAMNRRLGNTSPDKIEPRPFTTQFGEMRGGYAAITYDTLRSRRGEKEAAGESINPSAGLFGRNYFRSDTTTNGSLNKRIDSYTDRVDLDFHGIARKLNETIHDLAYRETLIDANKVIEHPEFRSEFKKAYGPEAYKSMRDWIGQLANSNNMDRSVGALGKFLQYTRTGMVINAIAFRASTVLKHGGSAGIKTMGYFAGGGEKYLAARFAAMGHDYSNQIASAQEKFGEIRNRLLQQDRDFRITSTSMFEPESALAKGERFGHAAVAWSDMMTAVPTAWAAYDRAITEGIPVSQGGTGAPMTETQAVHYANKIVREAHGSTAEAARSMVMSNQSEAIKMFTTLYGFMNTSYGQQLDGFDKLRTAGISSGPVLARTFMAIIVPALWAGYLSHHKKDDEGWSAWVGKVITAEVAGSVPFVRDAYSMVEGFNHAGLVAAENWLASLVLAGKDIANVVQGESGKGSPIKDIANAVGTSLHIPGLGQLGSSAQYAANVKSGKESPQNAAEYAKGLALGHGDKH